MRTTLLTIALVTLCAGIGYWLSGSVPAVTAETANGARIKNVASINPAPASSATSLARSEAAGGALPPSGRLPITAAEISQLGLTRQLAGEHRLMLEDRSVSVLGSKETVGRDGISETMLVLRDDVSGQLRYYRPGLQFALKSGTGYEAFVAEWPRMRLLFANPLHAQVAVDAADIAVMFNTLRADPRVSTLRFMTRESVKVAK